MVRGSPPFGARVAVVLAALLLVGLGLAGLAAPADAAPPTPTQNVTDKAPYYADNTSDVANESWMDGHEEPTLANVTHYLARVGGFVVGEQSLAGAPGSAGPLLTGFVLLGLVGGAAIGGGIGAAGGVALTVAVVGVLAGAALLPQWLYAVVLIGVALVATAALLRLLR